MPQFNVVLSYGTHAASPQEAIETALAAIATRSATYVEVYPDGDDATVLEGDLDYFKPEAR